MQCPNCKTPCVGCAGAKITKASNGATVCTKCIVSYETTLKKKGILTQVSDVEISNNVMISNIKVEYVPPKP